MYKPQAGEEEGPARIGTTLLAICVLSEKETYF